MKTSIQLKAAMFVVCFLMISGFAKAQMNGNKPPASPRDSVSGTVNGATITINYGSPSVRGRVIWGKLEPYDKVWRAGANEATRFTTSKDIKVEGKTLAAGTYGFFVTPSKKKWTVIFNSIPNQWGAFKYDSTKDVLRVMIKPKKTAKQERLIYTINDDGFALVWDKVKIPVKVK